MNPPSQPVRIAFCITDLDPGGAEWALYQLATRLDPQRWELRVFNLSQPGTVAEALKVAGIEVRSFGAESAGGLRVKLAALLWLRRELRVFSPQLVQGYLFHGNLVSRCAGWLAGVPVRLAGHRVAEREKRWHLWLDRWSRCLVQRHVCVSSGVAEFVRHELRLRPEQIVVIPNGIDVAQLASPTGQLRRELSLDPQRRIVLAVGRLTRQKGFSDLVQAFRKVCDQATNEAPSQGVPGDAPFVGNAHLVIVGSGEERANLDQQIRDLGLERQVSLLGYREDVPELIAEADLFVLSSLWEGMPNVVLQAMQCGTPLVTTSVEGIAELVQHEVHGLVVPGSSPTELAAAVVRLLADSALAQNLANTAQAHSRENFTWEETTRKYDRLFTELTTSEANGPA